MKPVQVSHCESDVPRFALSKLTIPPRVLCGFTPRLCLCVRWVQSRARVDCCVCVVYLWGGFVDRSPRTGADPSVKPQPHISLHPVLKAHEPPTHVCVEDINLLCCFLCCTFFFLIIFKMTKICVRSCTDRVDGETFPTTVLLLRPEDCSKILHAQDLHN